MFLEKESFDESRRLGSGNGFLHDGVTMSGAFDDCLLVLGNGFISGIGSFHSGITILDPLVIPFVDDRDFG